MQSGKIDTQFSGSAYTLIETKSKGIVNNNIYSIRLLFVVLINKFFIKYFFLLIKRSEIKKIFKQCYYIHKIKK